MEFQIHSHYDHKALKTIVRVMRKTVRRKWSIALRVFGWFAIALIVLAEIALASLGLFEFNIGDAFALLLAALMAATLLFEDDFNAWVAKFSLIPGTQDADTRFTSDAYTVTTEAAESRWNYAQIIAFCETPDSFVFLVGKRHGQQFPKDGMSEGTPDAFRDFIAQKTGLSAQFVK